MTLLCEERASKLSRTVMNIINLIISTNLYDSFNDLKDMMVKENEAAIERISFNSFAISQQNEMIRLLISRSARLLDRFTNVVDQLCQVMEDEANSYKYILHAKQQIKAEKMQWLELKHQLDTRKEILISKCKRKRSKHKTYYQKTISRSDTANDGQMGAKYSQAVKLEDHRDYKTNIRKEFAAIKQFVSENLGPKMQYSPNSEIPKKIILNVYLRWNRQCQRSLQFSDTGKIQMELTNQLKLCFPNMQMTRKTFKGMQFRSQLLDPLLTDKSPPFQQDQRQLDEDDFDSLDDILIQYEETKEEVSQE